MNSALYKYVLLLFIIIIKSLCIFLNPDVTVCTVFSASPLLEGRNGLECTALMLFYAQYTLNSPLVNESPLSETMM